MIRSLYSGKCSACKTEAEVTSLFCDECLKDIKVLETFCLKCGYPISQAGANCKRCDTGMLKRINKIYGLYHYSGAIRQMLLDIKFNYNIGASRNFKSIINLPNFEIKYDAVVPVPSHYIRRFRRFFHPTDLLANVISEMLEIELKKCLVRHRYTDFQFKRNANERKINVKDAFKCIDSCKNQNILLVDDILTTGNTISECAKILKSSGAKKIDCITLAID